MLLMRKKIALVLLLTFVLELLSPLSVYAVDDKWKAVLITNAQFQSYKSFSNYSKQKHSFKDYQIINPRLEMMEIEFNMQYNQAVNIELYTLKPGLDLTDENLMKDLYGLCETMAPIHTELDPGPPPKNKRYSEPAEIEAFKAAVTGEFLGYVVESKYDESAGTIEDLSPIKGKSYEGFDHVAPAPFSIFPADLTMNTVLWGGKVEKPDGTIGYPDLPAVQQHDGPDTYKYVPCILIIQPLGSPENSQFLISDELEINEDLAEILIPGEKEESAGNDAHGESQVPTGTDEAEDSNGSANTEEPAENEESTEHDRNIENQESADHEESIRNEEPGNGKEPAISKGLVKGGMARRSNQSTDGDQLIKSDGTVADGNEAVSGHEPADGDEPINNEESYDGDKTIKGDDSIEKDKPAKTEEPNISDQPINNNRAGGSGELTGGWTEVYMTFAGLKINEFAPIDQLGLDKIDLEGLIQKVDPINMINGNFVYKNQDLVVRTTDPLVFNRYYNNQDRQDYGLGRGWRHEYLYTLTETGSISDGNDRTNYFTQLQLPDGEKITFQLTPDGAYHAPKGGKFKLTKTGSEYTLYGNEGSEYLFKVNAGEYRLESILHQGRTKYTLSYNSDGQVSRVTGNGQSLTFNYVGQKLSAISDDGGSAVSYRYDSTGNLLIGMLNVDGDSLKYTYDGRGNLAKASDFYGNDYLENTYDEYDRVTSQVVAEQGTYRVEYDDETYTNTLTYPDGYQESFTYNPYERRIVKMEDSDSDTVRKFKGGYLSEEIDRLGRKTTYDYDGMSRLIKITYPDGNEKKFAYCTGSGLLENEIYPDGTNIHYGYDVNGNLTSIKDQRGNTSSFAYDNKGNITKKTDRLGKVTHYTYDSKGNLIKITDPENGITVYTYDAAGRITSETDPDGITTTYEYTAGGKLAKVTDAAGKEKEYKINNNGYLIGESDFGATGASKNFNQIIYNHLSQPVSFTDFEGNQTTYNYNERGFLSTVTDPVGNSTKYTYDSRGHLTEVTDSRGYATSFTYDAEGQLIKTKDPHQGVTGLEYDQMGRVKEKASPLGNTYLYTYDELGRVVSEEDPLGNTQFFDYDKNGNLSKYTDGRGNVTDYTYDQEDRLVEVKDPLSRVVKYVYDACGRLEKTIDGAGGTNARSYKASGRTDTDTDALTYTINYAYDSLGRVSKRTFADGTFVTFDYDDNSRITKVTDEEGGTIEYTYDKDGRLLSLTDQEGGSTSYAYDGNGQLTKLIDAEGGVYTYTYDASGNMDSQTDAEGFTEHYTYDGLSRLVSHKDKNGETDQFIYDADSNLTERIYPDGGKAIYDYDKCGRLVKITDTEGYETSLIYDANGNLTQLLDPRGNTVSYTYDAANQQTAISNQDGKTVDFTYDGAGRRTTFTDEEGVTTNYTYDAKGQITKITDGLGHSRSYTYDKKGRILTETDENNKTTQFAYNNTGQMVKVIDPLNYFSEYEYNKNGRLIKEINANLEPTWYTYDKLGRVTKIKDSNNHETHFTYDKESRIKTVRDRNQNTTIYDYDGNGNVVKATDPKGVVTNFSYDPMNRIQKLTGSRNGANQQTVLYQYDKRGLLTKTISAMNEEVILEYDGNGNLTRKVDEDGYETLYEYTKTNLTQMVRYADGKTADFYYNGRGELVSMEDWTGTTEIVRDALGQIEKVTDSFGGETGYTWDPVGNRKNVTYPNGDKATYTYNANNWLTMVKDQDGKEISYEYDHVGQVTNKAYPNGEYTTYGYNRKGELIQSKEEKAGGVTRRHYKYDYDDEGQMNQGYTTGIGADPKRQTVLYDYDEASRLTGIRLHDGSRIDYTYDDLGNLITERRGSEEIQYEYNNRNQLIRQRSGEGEKTFTYDKRGNLTEEKQNGQLQYAYTYDASNRLTKGANNEGETTEYVYNGLGMRVENTLAMGNPFAAYADSHNSPGSLHLGDIEGLLARMRPEGIQKTYEAFTSSARQSEPAEIKRAYTIDFTDWRNRDIMVTEEGSYQQTFLYANEEKLIQNTRHLMGKTDPASEGRNPASTIAAKDIGKVYIHQDYLGSTIFASGTNGEVVTHSLYDEWGVPQTPTMLEENFSSLERNAEYAGLAYDPVVGKYFVQARFYDPAIGRFLAEDSARDGQNWYAYCGGDPLDYMDPLGEADTHVLKARKQSAEKNLGSNIGKAASQIWNKVSNTIDKGYESAISKVASGKAYVQAKVDAITPQPLKQAQAKVNSVVEKIPEPVRLTAKTVAAPIITPNPVTPLASINPVKPPTDPEEFLKYNYGVKQGVESSLSGTADSLMDAVKHPIKTLDNIEYVLNHMPETCWAVGSEIVRETSTEILFGDSEDHGKIVGFIMMEYTTQKGVVTVMQLGKTKVLMLSGNNIETKLLLAPEAESKLLSVPKLSTESGFKVIAGKNFKDHFIRHKAILEKATGNKYPKYKSHGDIFLDDIGKIIDNGTVQYEGLGTIKKGFEPMNIYRGKDITIVTKTDGEFVTILEKGKGMDTAIQMVGGQ